MIDLTRIAAKAVLMALASSVILQGAPPSPRSTPDIRREATRRSVVEMCRTHELLVRGEERGLFSSDLARRIGVAPEEISLLAGVGPAEEGTVFEQVQRAWFLCRVRLGVQQILLEQEAVLSELEQEKIKSDGAIEFVTWLMGFSLPGQLLFNPVTLDALDDLELPRTSGHAHDKILRLSPAAHPPAVVLTRQSPLKVRAAADTSAATVGSLARGSTVSVLEEEGDWYLISSGELEGWSSARYLELQLPPELPLRVSAR